MTNPSRPAVGRWLRNRIGILAAVGCLLVVIVTLTVTFRADGSPRMLTVDVGAYTTISDALDNASAGDTIMIAPGIYSESIVIDTRISIEAIEGGVWIDGGCTLLNGIQVHVDGVTLSGIGIRKTAEAGIRVDGADDVTIENVTVQDFNCDDGDDQYEAGIALWEGSRLTVTGSTIARRVALAGDPEGFGNGIWVKNVSADSGGGHYIADNVIIGGFDGIGGEPEDKVFGGFYRDSTIERNQISDCWDDGIQVEGGNINVAVRDNVVSRCSVGVALAPTLTGPIYVERNEIRDLKIGYYDAQFAFKLGDGSNGDIFITENIVVSGGDGFKETNAGGVGRITSRRNIIMVDRKVIEIGNISNNASDFDEDCFWTSDPNRFISWRQSDYDDLTSFQNATGQEANGIEGPECDLPPPAPTTPPLTPQPSPTSSPTLTFLIPSSVPPTPTITPTPPVQVEDIDGNGIVDELDVLRLLQYVADLPGGLPGDLDCDQQATATDALVVMIVVASAGGPLPGC